MCKQIAFIACSKRKRKTPCTAEHMYRGSLFVKALSYTRSRFDEVYILSAKYGLLALTDKIKPYELTLNTMSVSERKRWSKKVRRQMEERNVKGRFTFFTGTKYCEHFKGVKPLKGLGLGYQLQWFTQRNKKKGFQL